MEIINWFLEDIPQPLFIVICIFGFILGLVIYWREFRKPRQYRMFSGRLQVKEGRGDWMDLEEHLRNEHPKEYIEYMEQKGKG